MSKKRPTHHFRLFHYKKIDSNTVRRFNSMRNWCAFITAAFKHNRILGLQQTAVSGIERSARPGLVMRIHLSASRFINASTGSRSSTSLALATCSQHCLIWSSRSARRDVFRNSAPFANSSISISRVDRSDPKARPRNSTLPETNMIKAF